MDAKDIKVQELVGFILALREEMGAFGEMAKPFQDVTDEFLAENFSYEASALRNALKLKGIL